MSSNWESKEFRLKFLDSINSEENKRRKAKSLQEYEIYNGNINQYVEAYLSQQLSAKTVKKMPVISSIDICRRIADQEASVYRTDPKREYKNISDNDKLAIENAYDDGRANIKMLKANRYFKLQNHCLLQILPKEKKLEWRVLFPHNFDVIPDANDPEKAESVIVSAFNKDIYVQGGTSNTGDNNYIRGNYRDNLNQISADQDDYKAQVERYVVWNAEYNFIMDGYGNILSDNIQNPIGKIPFVDIAVDKDYKFFVDRGSQLANFSVQYNAALSDLANIVRLQAYSQAVLIGPKEAMPENIVVGPTSIIKLAVDPNNPTATDFKFVSPSPDLAGSIEFIEVLISNFLSSRGLNSSTISGKSQTEKYASGLERFLSMIDRFEASKSDFALFDWVEMQAFELVKSWLVYYSNTEFIDKKYYVTSAAIDAELDVCFHKPETIQSDEEKLNSIRAKMELGLMSDIDAVMDLYNLDETAAEEKLDKIQERSMMLNKPEEKEVEQPELEADDVEEGTEPNDEGIRS